MKQVVVIIACAFCLNSNAFAQIKKDSVPKQKIYKHALFYNPLNLFIGRIKIDYENFALSDEYTLGASVTLGSAPRKVQKESTEIKVTKSIFGIEINNKMYLMPLSNMGKKSNLNMYLNLAPMYQRLEFEYFSEVWDTYFKNGILVYELNEEKKVTPRSNRIGLNPQIGFLYNNKKFALDFYAGLSLHKDYIKGDVGTIELPLNIIPKTTSNSSPIAGIKIGLFF